MAFFEKNNENRPKQGAHRNCGFVTLPSKAYINTRVSGEGGFQHAEKGTEEEEEEEEYRSSFLKSI